MERFWSKVKKTDGCWNWTASTGTKGYGQFFTGTAKARKVVRAHRLSWEMTNGAVPLGLCVLHRCDNRLCVRPSHLWLGTNQDNTDDMIAKGRRRQGSRLIGEQNPSSKLTRDEVLRLRKVLDEGSSLSIVASQFGVSKSTAWNIKRGKTWKGIS